MMSGGFFGAISNIGKSLNAAAGNLFSLDDDEEAGGGFVVGGGGGASFDIQDVPVGSGYELGYMYYRNPDTHASTYFFTTQLAAPFPSYHTNPLPDFPARVSSIPRLKPPVENIVAPRIRLGPRELFDKHQLMAQMRDAAMVEDEQPEMVTINLSHQCLGDPYQYACFVTFMDLNRNVKVLNLNDNELDDITDLVLPCVEKLHLSHNSFVSFLHIPQVPQCRELYLTNNFLSGLSGLDDDRFPKLRLINVSLNPIEHLEEYRRKVHRAVPTIEVVDGERV